MQARDVRAPASLVDWLPLQTKAELDQAPLARFVADTRIDVMARLFAAAALRDIGNVKPLEPASVEALMSPRAPRARTSGCVTSPPRRSRTPTACRAPTSSRG